MIRLATQQDSKSVFALASQLATSFVVTESGFSLSFSRALKLPHMHLAVAEVDSDIVGYVLGGYYPCFYASGNVAWTEEIFVESEHRNSGLGRNLMEEFENWAKENNCRISALATRRAASFYQALSYEESASYFKKQLREQNAAEQPDTRLQSKYK